MDPTLHWNFMPSGDEFLLDLHAAANIGCEETVRDIIENSENKQILNEQNRSGWTPLMYAACSTNLKILLLLLEEGSFTDIKNNFGQTALIIASKYGSTDTVSLLIDFKANLNIKDEKGWSAVFYASAFGHRSVVQLLMEKGATIDVDNEGLNPLMLSAAAGHERIVKDLLVLGLNPTVESKCGDTARSLAIKNEHLNVKNLIDTYYYSKENYNQGPQKCINNVSESELLTVLKELQLSKYYYIFENQGIDLNTFCMLTDEDLKAIGINLFGPRKKMCLAISKYHNHSNSENKDLLNKLSLENKKLLQQIEKLKVELSQETDAKIIAEKNLNEGVFTLKNFSANIQHSLRYALALGEKLKQNQSNLKKLLYCASELNNEQFKRNCIYPLLEAAERLVNEINHQMLISSQQTDFRY